MDSAKKAIKDEIDSMTIEQAREIVPIKYGTKNSEYHSFAEDCLAAKEAALRNARESESLSISKEANSIARKALHNSKWSNIIAITAIIIAIAAIIVAWLTKN